jgi:putative PIN family toxin of toxin-antitoxin system
MIRAMLDTNVLASAVIATKSAESVPGTLLREWRRQAFALVVSDHLLDELQRTLNNRYFSKKITIEEAAQVVWTLRHQAELTPILLAVAGAASHPEDDLVLAAVGSAKVDFLVTGDRKLQRLVRFRETAIVSPKAFALVLQSAHIPPRED